MRSICRGAEPRRLIRNSAGDMNFSSAKKKRPSSRNRLRCSAAERTRRPASEPTARVSDHFVSNSVRPDDEKFMSPAEFLISLRGSAPRHIDLIPDVIARDLHRSDRSRAQLIWDEMRSEE